MERNSLGLDGDVSAIELFRSIEHSFRIDFVNGELDRVQTVGQLANIIEGKLAARDNPAAPRISRVARAFARLEVAAKRFAPTATISTATRLAEVAGRASRHRFYEDLKQASGLDFDTDQLGFDFRLFFPLVIGCVSASAANHLGMTDHWAASFGVVVLVSLLSATVTLTFADHFLPVSTEKTFGDLARNAADLNVAELSKGVAPLSRPEIMDVIAGLAARLTERRRAVDENTAIV
ncbi:MAG: hypothetical protein GC199_01530 [Alphaproteobacteria bacterium]|nr:hypothetical protein [Alphaproteobacteria bacterium]